MPRWTSCLETLAYTISDRAGCLPQRVHKPWHLPRPRGAKSYSTASPPNQRGDTPSPAPEGHVTYAQRRGLDHRERSTRGTLGHAGSQVEEVLPLAEIKWTRRSRNRWIQHSLKRGVIRFRKVPIPERTERADAAIAKPSPYRSWLRAMSQRQTQLTQTTSTYISPRRMNRRIKVYGDRDRASRTSGTKRGIYWRALPTNTNWQAVKHHPRRLKEMWSAQYLRVVHASLLPMARGSKPQALTPILDSRVPEWISLFLKPEQAEHGQFMNFHAFAKARDEPSDYVWAQIALWLSAHGKERLLEFLLATHAEPFPPALFVADCLKRLASHHHRSTDDDKGRQLRLLAKAVTILAQRSDDRRLRLRGSFVRRVLLHCSNKRGHYLFHAIRVNRIYVTGWTYCHFVAFLAKHGFYRSALEALEAASRRMDVNDWVFLSVCSTLLRESISHPRGLRETLDIVSAIVDMGVKLDNPICDIIMLNAIEAGDLKTAFDVYHSLMKRGLKPTERTFAVLLKGCKTNVDDVEMLNEVIRDAISNVDVRRSNLVASNILHCLALHHSKHHPLTALQTLAKAYAEFFDISPLTRLQLTMPMDVTIRVNIDSMISASPQAIGVFIGASINHIMLRNRDGLNHVFLLYMRWRSLVVAGDQDLAPLATTDHVANLFLTAFVRQPSGLIHASHVIKDMQRVLPPSAGVEQAKPTVQSWNIFLHGYSRHGEMELAEQVREYMLNKGIKEDTTTWNKLVRGYARLQDKEGALETLRRGNESGAIWDQWSEGAANPLRSVSAKAELVRVRQETEVDFTEDLKDDLEARLMLPDLQQYMHKSNHVQGTSQPDAGFGDTAGDLAEQPVQPFKPF